MRVYIVADVEHIAGDGPVSDYAVADALAQTFGGECGPIEFDAEGFTPDGTEVSGAFRLTAIGAVATDVAEGTHVTYQVEALRDGSDGFAPIRGRK